MRFRLPFPPSSTELSFFKGEGDEPEDVALRPVHDPAWTADRGGPFVVRAAADGGDASYAGCLRIRGETSSSGAAVPAPGRAVSADEALAFDNADERVLVEGH